MSFSILTEHKFNTYTSVDGQCLFIVLHWLIYQTYEEFVLVSVPQYNIQHAGKFQDKNIEY